jgi:DNA-binding NtrC family response regulator
MPSVEYIPLKSKNALVVHSDLAILSALQPILSQRGFIPILARDLPTALLAMAQHRFELCILSVAITEKSDGWALAAVLRMCFPHAFVAMIAPQPDLLMLQTAINTGVTQLYLASDPPAVNAEAILRDYSRLTTGHKLQ